MTTEIPQTGKLPHPREFLFSLSWRQSELSASPRTLPGYGRRHSGSSACRPALRVNTALPRGDRRSDCRCRAFAALPWYQPLSEDLGHEGVHHLGRLPPYIVGDVGVGVQGEAGLGVAQDAKTLSGILGHTNASFTLDTYTHVTPDMQRAASDVVGGFLKNLLGEELNPWQGNEKRNRHHKAA